MKISFFLYLIRPRTCSLPSRCLSCQAMDAAGFLNPINQKFMHVVMLDKRMEAQQDKTYALLRSLGIVRQERYHNIFFDSKELSPDLVTYAISRMLHLHIEKFIRSLDAYNEWEQFDPYEYVQRNYGEKLLPEDDQIIKCVIKSLDQSGISPESLSKVADVGTGPNLYPAMLLTPYLKPDSKIDLLEFSPSNRDYLQKVINGDIEEPQAYIWEKFEQLMTEQGGPKYEGSEEKAKQLANILPGSIFELKEGEYDLISSYFVSESIEDSNMQFREAIQSLVRAVWPDGTLVVAHMVGSEGYYAGEGTHFPALNLSVTDIEQAYKDAGVEFSITSIGDGVLEKAREGYHGMAVVVGKRKI